MSQSQGGLARGKSRGTSWLNTVITILAVLLLAGLVFLWMGQREPSPAATSPTTPQTAPEPDVSAAPGTEELGEGAAEPAQTVTEVQPLPESEESSEGGLEDDGDGAAFAPVTSAPPMSEADASDPNLSEPNDTETNAAQSPSEANTVQPRTGGAVPTSAARVPTRSEYRISLGSFGSSAEAVQRTASVARIGYTVYSIDLGNQVVAQVGPFASAEAGQEALADIRRVYGGASLFTPVAQPAPSNSAPSNSAPSAPAASSTAPSTPTPNTATQTPKPKPQQSAQPQPTPQQPTPQTTTPTTPPPSAEASNVYLQVGAFEDFERAQQLVESLQAQGFAPSVNAPEGGMARVLIGPFSGAAIAEAEARLDANGYAHFRLR